MNFEKSIKIMSLLFIPFVLLSCGSAEESAIAKKITFKTTQGALVLPNDLDEGTGTCIAGGITGPRTRLRGSIKWDGEGKLLPLVIRLVFSDSRLDGNYNGTVSPGTSGSESLAGIFGGVTTDYIPDGTGTTYETDSCFLDYGTLPKPLTEVTGSTELELPATLSIFGVVRDTKGNDTPFVKEISTSVVYVAGSIPPSSN